MIDVLASYELSHLLPFAPEVYFQLFARQNAALWPGHLLAVLLAAVLVWRAWASDGRTVAALLAPAWLWVGWSFFIERYATLLWAAPYFGGVFILQAVLLVVVAVRGSLELPLTHSARTVVGLGLVIVGLVVLPLLGPLSGREVATVELFAFAPDPTVVVTLGAVFAAGRSRWFLMIIPLLWCVVAGLTAVALDYPAGLVTPALGAVALAFSLLRPR